MDNIVSFRVYGRYALFSDPINRVGSEKLTYSIPTYESIKGICESLYWKPTITWLPLRVKVLSAIQTESKNILVPKNKGKDLSIYTYLRNPDYIVEAKFIWNEAYPELACDRNENKHYFMAKRFIERGGRRDVYLGTRECQAYVEPCDFDSVESCYKGTEINFGIMVHGITYPSEPGKNMEIRLWNAVMRDGIISFIPPEECTMLMPSSKITAKQFVPGINFSEADNMEKEGWLI